MCALVEEEDNNAKYYESSKGPKSALAVEFLSPETKLHPRSMKMITI